MKSATMEVSANWMLIAHQNTSELEDGGNYSIPETDISREIYTYATPLVLTAGVGVNCLTIILVCRMGICRTSTNAFMFRTAILNIAAISTGLLVDYLGRVWDVHLRSYGGPGACKLMTFLQNVTMETSIWYVVGFTVYRYVVVCRPMRRADMSEPRTAAVFCASTLCLFITKNLYLFWSIGLNQGQCGALPAYIAFHMVARPWIEAFIDVVLPFVIIVVCNVVMACSLSAHAASSQQLHISQDTKTQSAVVYLIVALVFYLCLLPVLVPLLLAPKWAAARYLIPLKSVKNHLIYVHHSAYFFMYCLTGSAIRKELRKLHRDTKRTLLANVKFSRRSHREPDRVDTITQQQLSHF